MRPQRGDVDGLFAGELMPWTQSPTCWRSATDCANEEAPDLRFENLLAAVSARRSWRGRLGGPLFERSPNNSPPGFPAMRTAIMGGLLRRLCRLRDLSARPSATGRAPIAAAGATVPVLACWSASASPLRLASMGSCSSSSGGRDPEREFALGAPVLRRLHRHLKLRLVPLDHRVRDAHLAVEVKAARHLEAGVGFARILRPAHAESVRAVGEPCGARRARPCSRLSSRPL